MEYITRKIEENPNRHVVIFLIAAAFILAQFVVELILVSFLINMVPDIGTFLYAHQEVVGGVHIGITVILLWFAGRCGDHYCDQQKKEILK